MVVQKNHILIIRSKLRIKQFHLLMMGVQGINDVSLHKFKSWKTST